MRHNKPNMCNRVLRARIWNELCVYYLPNPKFQNSEFNTLRTILWPATLWYGMVCKAKTFIRFKLVSANRRIDTYTYIIQLSHSPYMLYICCAMCIVHKVKSILLEFRSANDKMNANLKIEKRNVKKKKKGKKSESKSVYGYRCRWVNRKWIGFVYEFTYRARATIEKKKLQFH